MKSSFVRGEPSINLVDNLAEQSSNNPGKELTKNILSKNWANLVEVVANTNPVNESGQKIGPRIRLTKMVN